MLCLSGFELYSRWVPLLNVSQGNEFRKLQRFSSKAVQKNSSFFCSGFLKMSKLKTNTVDT